MSGRLLRLAAFSGAPRAGDRPADGGIGCGLDSSTVRPPSDRSATRRRRSRTIASLGLLVFVAVVATLRWGGDLLVSSDSLPAHADAIVVLTGSTYGEQARREEAVRLLREERADRLVLSAPQIMYLGEWIPDLMRRYVERFYGVEQARRVVLCPQKADSTREEAEALRPCLERRGWRTVVVVTSNYHTRRASHIWRKVCKAADPPFRISVHGVPDGDFESRGWWRRRRYAKTFLGETIKLVWTYLFE